jgi:hypothetical protein
MAEHNTKIPRREILTIGGTPGKKISPHLIGEGRPI